MHVKQITTSQAFQFNCVSRKSFASFSLEERRAAAKVPRPTGYLRSQDSYLHIPQIYCNTLLSTNSTARVPREEPAITGLTRTPTEQNVTTMDGLIIAMCFPMVCCDGERREDYDTRYSICYASSRNGAAARAADALGVPLHRVQLPVSLFVPFLWILHTQE